MIITHKKQFTGILTPKNVLINVRMIAGLRAKRFENEQQMSERKE